MKKADANRLYAWATTQCALREYCPSQLISKLIEKGLPATEARRIVTQLEKEGFVDEQRYAHAFVHDKTELERWGRIKTRQALLLRGISEAVVAEAMSTIDEENYRLNLGTLLSSKRRMLGKELDPRKMREKLLRYAAARGYEMHLVLSTLEDEGWDEPESFH